MKTQILILSLLALITQACGGSSNSPTDATQTGVSNNTSGVVTTQSFTFTQSTQICTALKNWNPTLTNIQFPGDPGGYAVYLFTKSAITQNGQPLTSYLLNVGTGGTPVCTVTVTNGKIATVQ